MSFFSKPKYSKVNVKSREGVAKGLWTKCPESGEMVFVKELKKNLKYNMILLMMHMYI